MNSYTLHITLYDVFFFAMIFVGLAFALLLAFVKTINRSANRFLALALGTMILWMVRVVAFDIRLETYLPLWDRLPIQFLLALGPLMYFYALKITRPQYKFTRKDLLHFSPLLLELGAQSFQQLTPVLQLLIFISVLTYLYKSYKLIERFYKRLQPIMMDRSRLEFRWLRRLLAATALLWGLWLLCAAVDYFGYRNQLGVQVYYPFYIFFVVIIIWTAAAAFLKPQAAVIAQAVAPIKQPIPAELRAKGAWVKRAMETNLYYQDPDLSLSSLAEKLGMQPHELSKIINTVFNKGLSDFVNEYRVRDVVAKMQDPAYDNITLLGIAYEAGFNSKSTFSRAIKQVTGKTPVELKNDLENKGSFYQMTPRLQTRQIILAPGDPKRPPEQLKYHFMFRNYLKIAWRNIIRHKVYTTINVLGLSLGVCACLIIYLVTSFELSYDTFHPGKERIYRIITSHQDAQGKINKGASGIASLPMVLRNELTGFEAVSGFYNYFPKVTIPGANNTSKTFVAPKEGEQTSPVIVAEPQYFNVFKYNWLQGNPSTALNEPFKVVLSKQEAYKYFGTIPLQNVMGKQIVYNDSLIVTVTGIVEDWNKRTDFDFKDFISFSTVSHSFLKNDIDLNNWGMWDSDSQGYVKLANGVTQEQVEKQLPQFVKAHIRLEKGAKVQLSLQPLSDIHFNNHYEDSYSRQAHLPTLYGLVAIAIFILLIAAINFINLSTAQSLRRAKEVGVRKVLGSSKTNLTIQFLVETFIVTILALVIAVAAVNPLLFFFQSFIPKGVTLHLFSLPVILFLLGILIVTSLLAGFYPARVIASYVPALSLKGQGAPQLNHKSYLRKTLIVFQFTVSIVFIISTLLVADQNHFMINKDMGFNKDAIVTVRTDWNNSIDQLNVFCDEIRELPNVQMVSRHQQTPAALRHGGTIIDYKGAGGATVDASFDFCDDNYVPLFGLKIIAGRNLSHSDTLKEYLVNETCAKALGFKTPADAIGKTVGIGMPDSKRQIVGVINDFNSKSLHEVISPFFMCSIKGRERSVSIKLNAGKGMDNFKETIAQIESAWKKVYPNNKFEYAFFDETIAKFYDKEQKAAQLMNTAMLIAIFISCMGLFGLAIFTSQQRIKEIGIRKVLGASAASIVSMLSRDFLVLIIISLAIASPIAYYFMHNWLQAFAYRIEISPWTFLLSGSAAILIALTTISFHAIKAAVANPVKSLRSE